MFQGGLWAHCLAPDIAMFPLHVQWRGPDRWKVKAMLVNRQNTRIVYEVRTYDIYRKHFRFWSRAK